MKADAKVVWQGHAAHFVGAPDCMFHPATRVGKFLVSTVGDYRPRHTMFGGKATEVGYERFFETMVFHAEPVTGCNCWEPADFTELEMRGYKTHDEATAGHMAMIEEYKNK